MSHADPLETIGLEKRFGGIVAAHDVSLSIEKGARHALIGPNGAGKTTVINLLTGVLRPTAGSIILDGKDITALVPHQRVRLGMARTFQINQLFLDLTPLETIGLAVSERLGFGSDWWRLVGSKSRGDRRDRRDRRAFPSDRRHARAHRDPALWQAAAARNRARLRLPAAGAVARRAGGRRAGRRTPGASCHHRANCRRTSPCC